MSDDGGEGFSEGELVVVAMAAAYGWDDPVSAIDAARERFPDLLGSPGTRGDLRALSAWLKDEG